MTKKNWILPGLVAILVAAYFLMVGFSPSATASKDKSTCCCQKMKNCAVKTRGSASGEMILENLSRQFLSISPFEY
ncbi:MAG TPA: hypothetical protein VIV35_03200 [Chitinophagaceae bacterium]